MSIHLIERLFYFIVIPQLNIIFIEIRLFRNRSFLRKFIKQTLNSHSTNKTSNKRQESYKILIFKK